MTPATERAEKAFYGCSHEEPEIGACIVCIAAQIEQAEQEAFKSGHATGFFAAREKAKGIAEEWANSPTCKEFDDHGICAHKRTGAGIADYIAKMEPEK